MSTTAQRPLSMPTLSGQSRGDVIAGRPDSNQKFGILKFADAPNLKTQHSSIASDSTKVRAYIDREFGFTREWNEDLSRLDGWKNPYKWLGERKQEIDANVDTIADAWNKEFNFYFNRGYSEMQAKKKADKLATAMKKRLAKRMKVDFPEDAPNIKNKGKLNK